MDGIRWAEIAKALLAIGLGAVGAGAPTYLAQSGARFTEADRCQASIQAITQATGAHITDLRASRERCQSALHDAITTCRNPAMEEPDGG